ncbi:15968_t:CDS:2 [Dentiscutata heterogama]|uniref:15968_t:CDS:1 n=1 Tax=Dentiscutata heterogama TaxID=1316150 RepID=A0ACA9K2D0_9GLOM|nr:15968_t:CDS:2 [Dentiscutata heterogama]
MITTKLHSQTTKKDLIHIAKEEDQDRVGIKTYPGGSAAQFAELFHARTQTTHFVNDLINVCFKVVTETVTDAVEQDNILTSTSFVDPGILT